VKRRPSATTWVLLALGGILLLAGIEWGRAVMGRPSRSAAPLSFAHDLGFREGDPAPDFELPDREGRPHRLSALVRRDTVLCFTCGCANCLDLQTYLGILIQRLGRQAPQVIAVTSMPKESEASWRRKTRLAQTLLYEKREGPVMKTYQGHPCPRVFRLSADRKVLWAGPSPRDVPDLREIGNAMAENLGFPPE